MKEDLQLLTTMEQRQLIETLCNSSLFLPMVFMHSVASRSTSEEYPEKVALLGRH